MLTVFLFLNLSFKDFSLTVLVTVIDVKNKMKLNTVENRKIERKYMKLNKLKSCLGRRNCCKLDF